MDDVKLDTLEKRAQNALSGYTHDVNINCYVYGRDVLELVGEVRELRGRLKAVSAELQPCVTDNARVGEGRLPVYDALEAASVRKLCVLLGVGPR